MYFSEFTRNLERITKERQAMQSKLVPNLKSDWLRNIKIDLDNLNRDPKVGTSGGQTAKAGPTCQELSKDIN